jgi:hypothetical protein
LATLLYHLLTSLKYWLPSKRLNNNGVDAKFQIMAEPRYDKCLNSGGGYLQKWYNFEDYNTLVSHSKCCSVKAREVK